LNIAKKILIALFTLLDYNEPVLAKVCSAAVNGIEAYPVEVEVNAGYGDTVIVIVVNNTPKWKRPLFSCFQRNFFDFWCGELLNRNRK